MGLRAPTDPFAIARQRAQEQAQGQKTESETAIQRRLAGLGNLSGGAAFKLQERANQDVAKNLQTAQEGIDVAEFNQNYQQNEAEKQRQFAATEAEKGRVYGATEAEKQRAYEAQQAELGRGLTREQMAMQKEQYAQDYAMKADQFSRQMETQMQQFNLSFKEQVQARLQSGNISREQIAQAKAFHDQDMKFQQTVQAFNESKFKSEYGMAQKQFEMDKETTDFNKALAAYGIGMEWVNGKLVPRQDQINAAIERYKMSQNQSQETGGGGGGN